MLLPGWLPLLPPPPGVGALTGAGTLTGAGALLWDWLFWPLPVPAPAPVGADAVIGVTLAGAGAAAGGAACRGWCLGARPAVRLRVTAGLCVTFAAAGELTAVGTGTDRAIGTAARARWEVLVPWLTISVPSATPSAAMSTNHSTARRRRLPCILPYDRSRSAARARVATSGSPRCAARS